MSANCLSLASLMIATILIFSRCSKEKADPPVAGFSITGTNMTAPAKISFTNSSINAVGYSWNFGDGSTSNDENPTHIYQTGGTYTVTLEATGGPNAGITKTSKTITILNRYTTAKVTYVKVLAIPATKANGASWDTDNSLPDLYFKITDVNGQVYSNAAESRFTNSPVPVRWDYPSPYFPITPLSTARYFQIWDYDDLSLNDEQIGSIGFIPSSLQVADADNPYPSKFNITYQGISLEVGLQWQ